MRSTTVHREPGMRCYLEPLIGLRALRSILVRDCSHRARWVEIDRADYRPNRMVAFPSGLLHSASRHFGRSLGQGRIDQNFRVDPLRKLKGFPAPYLREVRR